MASGGSREQTLPNKNNPNPDLSDAKGDLQSTHSPSSASPSGGNAIEQQQLMMRSPSSQSSPNKASPIDQKFMILSKKPGEFKFEVDEMNSRPSMAGGNPPPIGQLFNNFYDNHSSDGSVKTFSNQSGSMYYDDYDSNSDDSEEINVT